MWAPKKLEHVASMPPDLERIRALYREPTPKARTHTGLRCASRTASALLLSKKPPPRPKFAAVPASPWLRSQSSHGWHATPRTMRRPYGTPPWTRAAVMTPAAETVNLFEVFETEAPGAALFAPPSPAGRPPRPFGNIRLIDYYNRSRSGDPRSIPRLGATPAAVKSSMSGSMLSALRCRLLDDDDESVLPPGLRNSD